MSEDSKMLPNFVEASPTLKAIAPCLRSPSENQKRELRKVSFPEEESHLVTGYLEPANPWEYAENVSREDLISTYKASCAKHGTSPLPHVLEQLQTLDVDAVRNECLDLKGEVLSSVHCETLEEVLKRVQFKNINLEGTALDDEGSVALFDMVEYYESATHLNISCNKNIGVRGWQACSRMIKKTHCLEQLEARNITLNEQFMPILSRALRIGTQLQVLKLENCNLSGRPIIILAAALKLNLGLRELYLADNNLGVTDAIQLGGLLRTNFTLQLLDISNNNIQDTGLGHISDGLTDQMLGQSGNGLSILVLWNNHLTRNASTHFARAVARSQTLETLNIGQNKLTNECLHVMKDSLQQNRTLLQLGMQSTHLTCEGAIALAECIADNPVIQRIDLRDNSLKVAGLMALALSLKVNTSVTQLDLDSVPKKKLEDDNIQGQYMTLVTEIRAYCTRNETAAREEEDTVEEGPTTATPGRSRLTSSTSRKISLTCETLLRSTALPPQAVIPDSGLLAEPRRGSSGRLRSPAPSPVPSPVSSPVPSPSRTRFQVSRVAESNSFLGTGQSGSPSSSSSSPITPPSLSSSPSRFFPSPTTSRFRVTLVEPSAPPPTVTSPSGNVTIGFTFKTNGAESTNEPNCEAPSDSAPQIQVVNSLGTEIAETAPGIAVTSSSLISHSVSLMTEQAPLPQNVKVTVKLDPNSDSLIIENEPSPSVASDISDDTADMEVRCIMDPCNLEGNGWVSCNVQDSDILLGRAGRKVCMIPDKEAPMQFPFPDVSDDETLVLQLNRDKNTCVNVQSCENPAEHTSATSTEKLNEQVGNRSNNVQPSEQVDNNLGTLKAVEWADNCLGAVNLNEQVDSSPRTVKPEEQVDDSSGIMKPDKLVDNHLSTVHLFEEDDGSLCTVKPDEQVANSLSAVKLNERVVNSPCTVKLGHMAGSLDSSLKQPGQVENNAKQMPPHRTRKISWVAPAEPVESKATSSLERLLGLFHSPGSFFNKTQQQYKATSAIVNPQPVANSNASFLLAAGPLGSIANGGSGLLSSGTQSQTQSSPDLRDTLSSETSTKEVKTKVKQSPGVSRKERKTSNCENPIPDIINNNKVQEVTILGSNDGSDENRSRLERKKERECITGHCEDENYNVPKLCEAVIKCKVSEDDAIESLSETVTCRSFKVGIAAEVKDNSDSKCNFSSKSSQNTATLEADDIETGLELLKLTDSSDTFINTSQCTDEGSGTELNIESNAIKSSPTNGINIKPVPCCIRDNDQFSVDFANGSPANSGLTNDKLWSRTCDSSFVNVQSAVATVRLVGGASGFVSCEMNTQRGDGASSQLLPDHVVDASAQPAGTEMEMLHSVELRPSNSI